MVCVRSCRVVRSRWAATWAAAVLPTITLGTFTAPLLLRIVRSSMLEVINLDYVRTARAKGVSEWRVILRHALKNAALPLVTVTGLQFGLLLGGAVITESVFAVPGVGRLIVDGIRQLDFPVVQAAVFMLAMIVVLVNFTVDILYEFVGRPMRRAFDVAAHTINLMFLALFGYAMCFKVLDILRAGEISSELRIPLWTGYTLASLGILAAVAAAAIRWWQAVSGRG